MKTRVTVTLPHELLREIDLQVKNRSRFILEAVERELERRRLELLRASLAIPHPESSEFAELGIENWVEAGSEEPRLLDPKGGQEVRWIPEMGWQTLG
ncbi:MAG: ribbon-helix-helix domain-containing protein [Vulcanimicrobiota bacterium]